MGWFRVLTFYSGVCWCICHGAVRVPDTEDSHCQAPSQRLQHPSQHWQQVRRVNSLATGRSRCDSKIGIFNLLLLIGIFRSSHDNASRWMPQDLADDKSTLVQVMAWCCEATSHYLSQCWLSFLLPYGGARPQWVKQQGWISAHKLCGEWFVKFRATPLNECMRGDLKQSIFNITLMILLMVSQHWFR